MKEPGAEEAVDRSDIYDEWNKFEKQRKKGIPADEKGRLNSSLKLKQSRRRNIRSQRVFRGIHKNPSLLEEDFGQMGAWCYSVLSEVMAKSQCTEAVLRYLTTGRPCSRSLRALRMPPARAGGKAGNQITIPARPLRLMSACPLILVLIWLTFLISSGILYDLIFLIDLFYHTYIFVSIYTQAV